MATHLGVDELGLYSITTGDIFSTTDATLVLTNDERLRENPDDDHSYLARLRNWRELHMVESGWPVRSQDRSTSETDLVLSISARGRVRASRAVSGGADEASIYDALPKLQKTRTMINDVYDVFGFFCAIGTRRAVYRRRSANTWEQMDHGCYDAEAFESEFTGLVGVERRALYAVGTLGEIWRYDGAWTREDSGTNQDFNAACVDSRGDIYVAGVSGVCLRGRNGRWSEASDPAEGYDIWSIVGYQGEIYATAGLSLVLRLDRKNGSFAPVDFGDCTIPTTAYHLKVRDGLLYCFGSKHIRRFDGQQWEDLITLS
jgi:hypothetical protein